MTLTEMKKLVQLNAVLGIDTDPTIIEKIAEGEEFLAKEQEEAERQRERIASKFSSVFSDLSKDISKLVAEEKQKTAEEQALVDRFTGLIRTIKSTAVQEDTLPPAMPLPKKTLVDVVVEKVADTKSPTLFVQPDPPTVSRDIQSIQNKLKLLEGWVSKISMAGPGSGEVNFRYLDDINRGTMTPSNDGWVLEYDAATKKAQFTEDIGPVRTVKINTQGHTIAATPGMLAWNIDEDCLDIHQADGTTLQTGLEQYIRVYNDTGATLANGTVVRFSGVYEDNDHEPTVLPHIANNSIEGLYTVGVLTSDIAAGSFGRATWIGKVRDLDTTGSSVGETWQKGDILYVHPSQPGKMTKVKPYAPNIVISVAAVLHAGVTNGILLVRPVIYPRMYYGSFSDTQTQTAAAANTAYAVNLRTTDIASGHHISSNTRVVAEVSGGYNYQFSLQLASGSASKKEVYIWARKNGTDVPDSASRITVTGNDEYRVAAWNFVLPMAANDYFELMWATNDTGVTVASPPATAFCPAIPSVIMTVTQAAL